MISLSIGAAASIVWIDLLSGRGGRRARRWASLFVAEQDRRHLAERRVQQEPAGLSRTSRIPLHEIENPDPAPEDEARSTTPRL